MNAERILRNIRRHPALFGEMGEAKERQAERIIAKAKARLAPQWEERARAVRQSADATSRSSQRRSSVR